MRHTLPLFFVLLTALLAGASSAETSNVSDWIKEIQQPASLKSLTPLKKLTEAGPEAHKQIVKLLDSSNAFVRLSAIHILGSSGVKAKAHAKALVALEARLTPHAESTLQDSMTLFVDINENSLETQFFMGSRQATGYKDLGWIAKNLKMLSTHIALPIMIHYSNVPTLKSTPALNAGSLRSLHVCHQAGITNPKISYGLESALILFTLKRLGADNEATEMQKAIKAKLTHTPEVLSEEVEVDENGAPVTPPAKSEIPSLKE